MKKVFMPVLTFISICFTIYLYKVNITIDISYEDKLPKILIDSKKYGEITNIQWIDNTGKKDNRVLFIANKENWNSAIASVYIANLESGKVEHLMDYQEHSKIKGFLQQLNLWPKISFALASNQGLNIISIENPPEVEGTEDTATEAITQIYSDSIHIPNFENADSMDIDDSSATVQYTTANNNVMNIYNYYGNSWPIFSNNITNRAKSFFKPSNGIIDGDSGIWVYLTERSKDKVDLVRVTVENGHPGIRSSKIIKNVVNIDISHGKIAAFTEEDDGYKIITSNLGSNLDGINIKKYNDILGQVPNITVYAGEVFYTKFDENHLGTIVSPQNIDIIESMPIVGPLRIKYTGPDARDILFLTYENGKIKVNLYDSSKNIINDISEIFN